ncbi:hypothetical protein NOVOSPHI9U_260032 [Novosphingobium sp. 9U]|nr:hypothetical protein NOVOSPHI9U_260032 [Novosphingobium sp. 9U]
MTQNGFRREAMLQKLLRLVTFRKEAGPVAVQGYAPISQQEYRAAFRRVDEAHLKGRPRDVLLRDALVIKGYSRPAEGYDSFGWPEGDPRSPNAIIR